MKPLLLEYGPRLVHWGAAGTNTRGHYLRVCTSLEHLDLNVCRTVSSNALGTCVQACAPRLRVLRAAFTNISTDALMTAPAASNLEELDLTSCSHISGAAVDQMLRCCTRLRRLEVAHCSQVRFIDQGTPALGDAYANDVQWAGGMCGVCMSGP